MFINFWYPALTSAELDGPVHVRMLGLDFVLARDSQGRAMCLSDTCVHRGGSLGRGRRRGDCVECPYHGWQFDRDGRCVRIPSMGADARPPVRARVDSYPVCEQYGIVFVFLGDLPESERLPIMPIPEYGREGWRANLMSFEARCNYERSVENALDPAHTEFVHPRMGFQGERADYRVPELTLERRDPGWFFMLEFKVPTGPGGGAFTTRAGTGYHSVSQFYTYIEAPPYMCMYQYMYELPIDEGRTRIFLVNLRNTMLEPEHDERVMRSCSDIVLQDVAVLEAVRPVVPPVAGREFLVAADAALPRYRDDLDRWTRLGWRIDTRPAATERRRRSAFAIPSPARREGGSWVLDAVPLVPGAAGAGLQAPVRVG